ncbi:MAG: hypothetical protein SFW67_30970 [Myxococcaceae bacterium]|nr:hypothetical protein [Myxococcaceae bacterium]
MRAVAFALLGLVVASPAWARRPRTVAPSSSQLPRLQTFGEQSVLHYQFSQTERVEVSSAPTIVSVSSRHHTPAMGWFPMRVSIDNTGGPKQTMTLAFRSVGGGSSSEVKRVVEVAAGERRNVTLSVPAELHWGQFEASSPVIGRQSQSLGFTAIYEPARLVLAFGTPEAFEAFARKKPDNTNGEDQVLTMSLDEAPTELSAYLGFHAVALVDPRGFEGLSDAQRGALEGWVATGGSLVLQSRPTTPAVLPLLEGDGPMHRYGFGAVTVLDEDASFSSVPLAQLPVEPLGQLESRGTRRYGLERTSTFEALLPQAIVPVARFLVIITLFTLLIGPGSVFIARKRGPAVLLATIPITAFATCVLILGSSVLLDGFRVHAATYGYTLLDREQHRAVTLGLSGWYANLAPRTAAFDGTTGVIAPRRNGEPTPVSLEWRDGARFGAGFVPSRTYREWGFASVAPSRARLVARREGSRVVLQNALGERIDAVWVRLDGSLYVARDVRDGGEVTMEPDDRVDETGLSLEAARRFVTAYARPLVMAPLEDGQFLARVQGTAFVPMGGLSADLHAAQHVVRGEVEP